MIQIQQYYVMIAMVMIQYSYKKYFFYNYIYMDYKEKYLKYKNKYIELKKLIGGNVIKTPDEYIANFNNTDVSISDNLVGRVLRGSKPDDFLKLSPDENRKLIMFMDSTGLQQLLGKDTRTILEIIGYSEAYMKELFTKKTQFKLVVATKGDNIVSGTWDNLLKLVKDAYGETTKVSKALEKNLGSLKTIKFDDIMKQKDSVFSGKMTQQELEEREGKLWEIRMFLKDVLNLNDLYSGDGYTYNDKGERGVPEYFSKNMELTQLGKYSLMDLNY